MAPIATMVLSEGNIPLRDNIAYGLTGNKHMAPIETTVLSEGNIPLRDNIAYELTGNKQIK